MASTLPHTENGFAQIAAEHSARENTVHDDAREDSTTLKVTGRMAVKDEEAGGDPYNHTGKFRRLIR